MSFLMFYPLQVIVVSIFLMALLSNCIFLKKSQTLVFQWPLKKYTLTQKFLPYKRTPHLGIDLKSSKGTKVFSAHSGRVIYAGRRLSGYGNVVMLKHHSHWTSLYAHLQKITVKLGQRLAQGELIGFVGDTGRTSGPHLHFELMYKERVLDPLMYLPQN